MKFILSVLGFSLVTTVAFAETKTYAITGMTCEGCVSMITDKVCAQKQFTTCKVEVGEITLTSKKKINDKEVSQLVSSAGRSYELVLPAKSTAK